MTKVIGVIGGSGLYEMEGLKGVKEVKVRTPFGLPSDSYITGVLDGKKMVFLPRHGRGHRILPSEINFKANIFGMKLLGVEWIISVSAVGSMKEGIEPGHIVIPDQFFDRTMFRPNSFFGKGIAVHISIADPVCPTLADLLFNSAREAGATVHKGGTYLCIEGPQFSTRGESRIYRQWGVDVIGMTNIPEAKLAREAEICYSSIAMVTDYDVWHEKEEDVAIESVLEILKRNVSLAMETIRRTAKKINTNRTCECATALQNAIITDRKRIPARLRKSLKPLIGKYIT